MLTGCYKITNAYANVKGVFTNTNPVDAYRGAGRPEAAYLIERLIDKSARELNISPLEIRKINLIDEKDMPVKLPELNENSPPIPLKQNKEFINIDIIKKKKFKLLHWFINL